MTENGRFGGLLRVPRVIFGEPMRVQPIPRDVRSIVQPYSTSVQPRAAWAFYVCSTWFMQVLGDFWAVFGFPGLSGPQKKWWHQLSNMPIRPNEIPRNN